MTEAPYINRRQATLKTGFAYLGNTASSHKIILNHSKGVKTHVIYLAPANLSGYNVCPMATQGCKDACLFNSGHNRIDTTGRITNSRIKKTRLFYENRDYFMKWLVDEIAVSQKRAQVEGFDFSVRLNGTSDLSPEVFKLNGKNILQLFPEAQFYDYTKVPNRFRLLERYDNYDLTFSYSGENWNKCEEALSKDVRVSVVFEKVPAFYKGLPVVNGDESDLRYLDAPNVIVGLRQKKVRHRIDLTKQKFIIRKEDKDCIY